MASPHVAAFAIGRRFPIGITTRAIAVVTKKENRKAWLTPGHLRMSIAIMDCSSSPVLVTVIAWGRCLSTSKTSHLATLFTHFPRGDFCRMRPVKTELRLCFCAFQAHLEVVLLCLKSTIAQSNRQQSTDMSHWAAHANDSSRTPVFVYRGGKTSNQKALPLSDEFFHGLPER